MEGRSYKAEATRNLHQSTRVVTCQLTNIWEKSLLALSDAGTLLWNKHLYACNLEHSKGKVFAIDYIGSWLLSCRCILMKHFPLYSILDLG